MQRWETQKPFFHNIKPGYKVADCTTQTPNLALMWPDANWTLTVENLDNRKIIDR